MFRLVEARPLPRYRLFLRYDDGVEGEVDLSELVGRGVFSRLSDPREFEKVAIGPSGEIQWNGQLDLCPDSLYMKITGQSPADLFPDLVPEGRETELNA
jgi:Protein of unknown function (DUF2442)